MKTALILILSLFAAACSVEEIQDEFSAESDHLESIEGGTWSTDCLATNSGGFQKRTASYSNGNYTQTTTAYSDLCETIELEVKETGSYALWGPTSDDSIMIKINRRVTDYTVTPHNTSVASAYNAASICGLTNWSSGNSLSVAGKVCNGATMPVVGQIIYDLYGIALDTRLLRFGSLDSTRNGTSANTRPNGLARNPPFHR